MASNFKLFSSSINHIIIHHTLLEIIACQISWTWDEMRAWETDRICHSYQLPPPCILDDFVSSWGAKVKNVSLVKTKPVSEISSNWKSNTNCCENDFFGFLSVEIFWLWSRQFQKRLHVCKIFAEFLLPKIITIGWVLTTVLKKTWTFFDTQCRLVLSR